MDHFKLFKINGQQILAERYYDGDDDQILIVKYVPELGSRVEYAITYNDEKERDIAFDNLNETNIESYM